METVFWAIDVVGVLMVTFLAGVTWGQRDTDRDMDNLNELSLQRSRELEALKIEIAMNVANMRRTAKTETMT
jgi:hypothetical protein